MGYMGFGMQKWIYTQKPKKLFSKEKKIYGDHLDKLPHSNQFNNQSGLAYEKEKLVAEIENSNKTETVRKRRLLVISLISALILCYLLKELVEKVFFPIWA